MNPHILETKSLTKKYGSSYAIHDLALHVPKGKIYGLLGRNGAGKTTAMKVIMQLCFPTAGEVFLFGHPVKGRNRQLFGRVGSIIETPGFYSHLTAYENLAVLAKLRGLQKPDAISQALAIMGLDQETKKPVGAYSLGMNQRLGIAAAILHEPELLILDEPTNGLDPIGIREMRALLRRLCDEQGTTILISSHILGEIEQLVDCIGILQEGRLLQEISMEELHAQNRNYLEIRLSQAPAALLILERNFHTTDYQLVDDGTIRLYDLDIDAGKLNRALVEQGIDVFSLYVHESSLEDYFTTLTGGKGIA